MEKDRKKYILGCDIGNGYAYISVLLSPDSDPLPMFPAGYNLNSMGMPTTAYITPPDGSKIEVFNGRPAIKRYARTPEKFVHAVKTRLKENTIQVEGILEPVSTEKIYAAIARDLIALANEERKNKGESPIYEIVFAFPASISDDIALLNRMQKSIEDIQFGNQKVKVAGRLPEPAAVAIDYLYYMQHLAEESIRLKEDHFTVLVYDLGHGTFDTAVVTARSKGKPYQVHSKNGLPDVGGKDFDTILYKEICRILQEQYQYVPKNAKEKEDIRLIAIEMKHALSKNDTDIQEIQLPNGGYAEVEITRKQFEKWSSYLMNQTLELVENVLNDAQAQKIKINAVVLSGGASQMPMVKNGLEKLLEDEAIPIHVYRTSESVSYGTARYAYGLQQKSEPQPQPKPKEDEKEDTTSEKKKENPTNEPKSNTILEQFTDWYYGIWVPSKENIAGCVQFMVKSGEKLPAVSKTISLISAERLNIKVYRKKVVKEAITEVEQCDSIIWLPFDVPPNSKCTIKLVVQEDYNVQVICTTNSGLVIEKSTADKWK
ncbi:MAG: Hsp70 family protein [Lachnospiraceae bacterium]|nr:Hsp70 family protein [Lachnospiraceae bacterium]